ncbi:hypothetical protein PsorP6_003023 [Peronosclerospora sorghi]|uniref:Uncharacterized protein n=1 Tax=Peronosclerospora sorghi TaxID=230839 RepID=A0ACC0VR33_9STRA|nr:hypothetical protein PsorP6_003023 [Peronosclerospora sorghi]
MESSVPHPPQKNTNQRTRFTNAQRLQICNHRERNPGMSQNELATWAYEAFNLPRRPSQAVISKVLKRKLDLETMTNEELVSKARRSVKYPQLDTALARWVSYCEDMGIPVTGEAIRLKAATFSAILHIDAPLTFSNGWLYKFNERHGFGCMKAQKGKKVSADQVIADLQRRLSTFDPRNVFSMDETGLLFTLAVVHAGFNPDAFQHVKVLFLPPGSPSTLLPMTAGIIVAFKRRYRQRQIQYVLDHLDADADVSTFAKFDSIGVRQALTWCIDSWNAIPPSVIVASWQETGMLYASTSGYECPGDEAALTEELAVMLSWLHALNPLTVDELLHLPEENVTMDEPSDEDFCAPMESVKKPALLVKPKPVNPDGSLSSDEIKEYLKWIAKLLIYANEKNIPSDSLTGMRMLQRSFRDQLAIKKENCLI